MPGSRRTAAEFAQLPTEAVHPRAAKLDTLAPEASLTQIANELRTAFDWLESEAANHGIEGPIIVTGWSAGGLLTALALDHRKAAAALAIVWAGTVVAGSMPFLVTHDFENYDHSFAQVSLNAGQNSIVLFAISHSGVPRLDTLTVTRAGP